MTGITIARASWAAVTAGEYDRRTRTITVNLTVVHEVASRFGHTPDDVVATIVAHERVHVLSGHDVLPHHEEQRAREAATAVGGADLVGHIDAVLAHGSEVNAGDGARRRTGRR